MNCPVCGGVAPAGATRCALCGSHLAVADESDGRATRSEYWWFLLVNVVLSCIVAGISIFAGAFGLYFLYGLAVMIPSFAVTVRRLNDTGRSERWWLLNLVPNGDFA